MNTNPFYLTYSPSRIGLIQGEKMPVKDFPDFWPKAMKAYTEALDRAKAEAVPVADKEKAEAIIKAHVKVMYNAERINDNAIILVPGDVYGPFTSGYEIRKKCRYSGSCPDCELGSLCQQVAILYDTQQEKQPLKYFFPLIPVQSQEKEEMHDFDKEAIAAWNKKYPALDHESWEAEIKGYASAFKEGAAAGWDACMKHISQQLTITRK